MTTLAIYQCLDRANALLRARVIFFGGAFSFVLSFIVLTRFSLFFSFLCDFKTYNKFNDIK